MGWCDCGGESSEVDDGWGMFVGVGWVIMVEMSNYGENW